MLVLSRRPNEAIVLPVINTRIQVVGLKGGVVRLGIQAPAAMSVYREEVWQEMQARAARGEALPAGTKPPCEELGQLVRNRVHSATVGMAHLREQIAQGHGDQASSTLGQIELEFDQLLKQLDEVKHRFAAADQPQLPPPNKPHSQPLPRSRQTYQDRQPRSAGKPAPAASATLTE